MTGKNRPCIFCLYLVFLCLFSAKAYSAIQRNETVKLAKVIEIRAKGTVPFDSSGITLFEDKWLLVSDKSRHNSIYSLEFEGASAKAVKFLGLNSIKGKLKSDFEGITFCFGHFLISDENSSSILSIDVKGAVEIFPIDPKAFYKKTGTKAPRLDSDAGFEGIACDEEKQVVYLAREQRDRQIYALKWPSLEIFDAFDVDSGWSKPKLIEGVKVHPDFSDLHFTGGYLYALERATKKVLKIDPAKHALVSSLDLGFEYKDYYAYPKPIGLADGLYLTKDKIYIVMDNNGTPRKGNPDNYSSVLLEFARPVDF